MTNYVSNFSVHYEINPVVLSVLILLGFDFNNTDVIVLQESLMLFQYQ